MTEEKYTVEDLKFQRLLFPRDIPSYLIEQVKGRTFLVEDFYLHLEEINAYEYQEGIIKDNPTTLIYSIIDPNKCIVGYLWIQRNTLDNSIYVNTLSIDKKYWGKGEIIKKSIDLVSILTKRFGCAHTIWMTSNAKFYEKFGFKRSKNVAMEYSGLGLSDDIEKRFKEEKDG
jgi:hypothetical protein